MIKHITNKEYEKLFPTNASYEPIDAWKDTTAGKMESNDEYADITTIILNSPKLMRSIKRAIRQIKKGKLLTHRQAFGKD